jgi:site-specific DNA recombinase
MAMRDASARLHSCVILSNSLYVGVITYDRQRFVKDPATGRRKARPNPPSEWLTTDLPELRIIDQETWDLVQFRKKAVSNLTLPRRNRPRHLLSGLLACGACGASYIVVSHAWLGCSAVRNTGTCNNRLLIKVSEVEGRVLAALQFHLLTPEAVAVAVEVYRAERLRLFRERSKSRNSLERDLAEVRRKIAHVTKAIEDGGDLNLLVPRLNELGLRQEDLARGLSTAADRQVVAFHPQAAERYRQKVAEIREALTKGDSASTEAISLVRDLVGRIVVHPAPDRSRLPLEIAGDLAALMSQEQEPNQMPTAVVAGHAATYTELSFSCRKCDDHRSGGLGVGSSNLPAPTNYPKHLACSHRRCFARTREMFCKLRACSFDVRIALALRGRGSAMQRCQFDEWCCRATWRPFGQACRPTHCGYRRRGL